MVIADVIKGLQQSMIRSIGHISVCRQQSITLIKICSSLRQHLVEHCSRGNFQELTLINRVIADLLTHAAKDDKSESHMYYLEGCFEQAYGLIEDYRRKYFTNPCRNICQTDCHNYTERIKSARETDAIRQKTFSKVISLKKEIKIKSVKKKKLDFIIHKTLVNGSKEDVVSYEISEDATTEEIMYKLSKGKGGVRVSLTTNIQFYIGLSGRLKTMEDLGPNYSRDDSGTIRIQPIEDLVNFLKTVRSEPGKKILIHVLSDSPLHVVVECSHIPRVFSLAKWDEVEGKILLLKCLSGWLYDGRDLAPLISYRDLSQANLDHVFKSWKLSRVQDTKQETELPLKRLPSITLDKMFQLLLNTIVQKAAEHDKDAKNVTWKISISSPVLFPEPSAASSSKPHTLSFPEPSITALSESYKAQSDPPTAIQMPSNAHSSNSPPTATCSRPPLLTAPQPYRKPALATINNSQPVVEMSGTNSHEFHPSIPGGYDFGTKETSSEQPKPEVVGKKRGWFRTQIHNLKQAVRR